MKDKQYFVYLMGNKSNAVLYAGVTSNLLGRVWQHKAKVVGGFTKRYNVNKLLYYEIFGDPVSAIGWEKQIKAGSRSKKIELIGRMNPQWKDCMRTCFHEIAAGFALAMTA